MQSLSYFTYCIDRCLCWCDISIHYVQCPALKTSCKFLAAHPKPSSLSQSRLMQQLTLSVCFGDIELVTWKFNSSRLLSKVRIIVRFGNCQARIVWSELQWAISIVLDTSELGPADWHRILDRLRSDKRLSSTPNHSRNERVVQE